MENFLKLVKIFKLLWKFRNFSVNFGQKFWRNKRKNRTFCLNLTKKIPGKLNILCNLTLICHQYEQKFVEKFSPICRLQPNRRRRIVAYRPNPTWFICGLQELCVYRIWNMIWIPSVSMVPRSKYLSNFSRSCLTAQVSHLNLVGLWEPASVKFAIF